MFIGRVYNNNNDIIKPIVGGDKGVHTFHKGISAEVNVIERLEFELAFFQAAVQHVSHLRHGDCPH